MKNQTIKLAKLAAIIVVISISFYLIKSMKNEPHNFNPDKDWSFMLINKDSNFTK